jgi:anti-anti-sigma factor
MASPDHSEAAGLLRPPGARSSIITIPLSGELDNATEPATMAYIRRRLPDEPADILFDLSETLFFGSAGLHIFFQLKLEGHRVRWVHAHGTAALVLSIGGTGLLG